MILEVPFRIKLKPPCAMTHRNSLIIIGFLFFLFPFVGVSQRGALIQQRMEQLNRVNQIKIPYTPLVLKQIDKFSNRSSFPKTMALAKFYFPLFSAKLYQYGLPEELKYLTIVESGLRTVATSGAGAQGLWQFMPATGRELGLYETKYVNRFNDPVAATDAACRYLEQLYKDLKNWELALAAYNCGIGRVKKILRKTGKKTFWEIISHLPKETQQYVPSFLAVQYVMHFYKDYDINPYTFAITFKNIKILRAPTDLYINNLKFKNQRDKGIFEFLNPHIKTAFIPKGTYFYTQKK